MTAAVILRLLGSLVSFVREAKDALRLRYAHGEISREEYLQGKIELED